MASRRKQKDDRREEREQGEEARMRSATRQLVVLGRQSGHDGARIRAEVTRALNEALGRAVWETQSIVVDSRIAPLADHSRVFRHVLDVEGIDRRDPKARNRWLAVVHEELDRALSRPTD